MSTGQRPFSMGGRIASKFRDILAYMVENNTNNESIAPVDKHQVAFNRRQFALLLLVIFLLVGVVVYLSVQYALRQVLEFKAITIAEIVSQQASNARTVYAREVASKLEKDGFGPHINSGVHKGFVPLPAQFLKELGHLSSAESQNLFQFKPVSRWNLEPNQNLSDDFLRWAWDKLEAQDSMEPEGPIDWQPAWRYESLSGQNVLRFLVADPASGDSCVNCHNNYERDPAIIERRQAQGITSTKQWRKHQLLGAISVTVPLEKVAKLIGDIQGKVVIAIMSVVLLSLIIIVWFGIYGDRQMRKLSALSWMATHDTLTGLSNRRGFYQHLIDLQNHGLLRDSTHLVCLLDLDGFKAVNDTHGHPAGDYLLQQLAHTLKSRVRDHEIVARLGGDEFAVIFHNVGERQVEKLPENLLSGIVDANVEWNGQLLNVGASIGVAVMRGTQRTISELMDIADRACYQAKTQGKGRIVMAN